MGRRVILVSVWLVALVLAGFQIWAIALSWNHQLANDWYWRPFALSMALAALVYVLMGMLVFRRRPENRVGPLLAMIGITILLYQATSEYALRGLVVAPGSLPGSDLAAILSQTIWIVPFSLVPVLLLVFPTGRFLTPWWRIALVLPITAVLVLNVSGLATMWPLRSAGAELLFGDLAEFGNYAVVVLPLMVASLVAGIASVAIRWRRSSGVERLQMKWFVPAGIILLIQILLVWATPEGSVLGEILLQVGLASIPVLVGLAILRYRLYDIDRIVSRTVAYGTVIALLIGVYLAAAALLTRVLPFESDIAVAGSTLAAAAMFNPLRRRVSRAVDHRFNRSKYDAERVVGSFASRLSDEVDPDRLADDWAAVVSRTLQPVSVAVWLREDDSRMSGVGVARAAPNPGIRE